MFLSEGSGFTFLVGENVFWMVLYLASSCLKALSKVLYVIQRPFQS